jgi:hypothetical protein
MLTVSSAATRKKLRMMGFDVCSTSLRGAQATKQSIFEFAAPWIASLALAMTT